MVIFGGELKINCLTEVKIVFCEGEKRGGVVF